MPSRRSLMLGFPASLLVSHANSSEEHLLMHASGYFDVTLAPQAAEPGDQLVMSFRRNRSRANAVNSTA
jgi:uncharacterized protein YbgA (DUF1722 family)